MKKSYLAKCLCAMCVLAVAGFAPLFAAEEADYYEDAVDLSEKMKAAPPKKRISFLASSKRDPILLGEGSNFEYNLLNTDVEQKNIEFYYMPQYTSVAIKSSNIFGKSYFCMDEDARRIIRNGLAQYLDDFEQHRLIKKTRKTQDVYGEFTARYKWGLVGASNETHPKTSVGYIFVKKSPYFALSIWPAEGYAETDIETDDLAGSEKMTLFFTKKQASELVAYLDEDYLLNIAGVDVDTVGSSEQGDEY